MAVRKSLPSSPAARILLVDHNVHGLSARRSVLEELGYTIAIASSALDALERYCEDPFDLVVTDYKMPRMNGIELIANLRKRTPGLPVILISGFADALGMNEENTGADVVIQKSANEVAHLVRSVHSLLRRKKPPSSERPTRQTRRKPG